MNKRIKFFIFLNILILLCGCNSHIHNHIDGVCECGDKLTYLVIFKDYDGTILREEYVRHGHNAIGPENPIREGYDFDSWSENYNVVTKDLIIYAKYSEQWFIDSNGLPSLTKSGEIRIKEKYYNYKQYFGNIEELEFDRYLGMYNDADVFRFKKSGIDDINYEIIEDYVFRYPTSASNYEVLYNNKFYTLTEAYDKKILSYENIKQIFKYSSLFEQYDRFYYLDEYAYRFNLSLLGEKTLKDAYYNYFLKDSEKYIIDDVYIKEYICSIIKEGKKFYHAAIFDYKDSKYEMKQFKEQIADYEFVYENNNTIKILIDNKFYSLNDAYDLNLINNDDIGKIHKYYNKKYTVEYILDKQNDAISKKPQMIEKIKQMYLNKFYSNSNYTIDDIEIKEMYGVTNYGIFYAKLINTKDIKEEKLFKSNINGYEIIDDINNPILYFYQDKGVEKVLTLKEGYDEGYLYNIFEIIKFIQENIYYKTED